MKCPKCGYLGFEPVERCRNCGYDFSLAAASVDFPEFPIREESSRNNLNPLDDLALIDAATAGEADLAAVAPADLDRDLHPPLAPPRPVSPSSELPLFRQSIPDDEPLITRASPPRAPLAVRRATPEVPRMRAEQPRPQSLDLMPDALDRLEIDDDNDELPESRVGSASVTPAARAESEPWPAPRAERPEPAQVGTRLVAVIIDLVLLGIVDAIVIYFTMQICGITLAELGILPKGPLLAFLLVQNGGYLVAFTVGGQTLGKMATGIRVIATESAGTLDLGRATTRTIVWLMLAIPAGLGFLTLFSRDHRGLHDRFAGTRVVRASV